MSDQGEVKRGPGRPPRQEEVKERRRRREDMGANRSLKLYVPDKDKDPNFQYRFVNNKPGRIKQFTEQDDYDVVTSGAVDTNSIGTTTERVVSQSTGETAILLRKPKKYFEEDQKQKQQVIDDREKAMKRAAPESAEGLTGPHAYVPGGVNRIGK